MNISQRHAVKPVYFSVFIRALNADNHVSSHPIQALRPTLSVNSNPRAGLSLANVWNESESSRGPIMNVFSFFSSTTGL
jgi:hypothetical protein